MKSTCHTTVREDQALALRTRLPRFDYIAPASVREACSLLAEPGSRVIAGGTDLLVKLSRGLLRVERVVSLKNIPGRDQIEVTKGGGLRIGAGIGLAQLAIHPEARRLFPAVANAAAHTATVQIRNRATLGGNICNASPCADNVPTLMALDASVIVAGPEGERQLPLGEVFAGPSQTMLGRGELVTAIVVPAADAQSAAAYERHSARSRVDLSAVNVGVMVSLAGDRCHQVRIVLGAVAPTPMRARAAEDCLRDQPLNEQNMTRAARIAAGEAKPLTDVRASAEYRREMVAVLTARALWRATRRAGGQSDG